jgi:biotin transport system substrate-specific component
VPYTFQTFAVLATGVYLRRNDAFISGCLYLVVGAFGAPVFAEGGAQLFDSGKLIASGGYLMAFPFASALVAEGLDRSRSAGVADIKAQLICWTLAMIPVYVIGTLWLAESYSVDFAQAYEWGVEPFLIWDFAKIVIMALVTTKFWSYSQPE